MLLHIKIKRASLKWSHDRRWVMAADLGQRVSWMLWQAGVWKVTYYSSEYEFSGRPTILSQRNKMKPLKNAVLKVRGVNSGLTKRAIGIVLFLLKPCEKITFKGIFHICTELSLFLGPIQWCEDTAAKGSNIRKPSSAAMWCQCDKMIISS